jgi:GMP synthase (glutamine-hydrolysing)
VVDVMKSVLAIRHVHFEDLGAFGTVLETAGYTIRYSEAGLEPIAPSDADAADLLVVLGGPIGVYDDGLYPFLRETARLLERRLAAGRHTLGICLGAQLMAHVLGARVYPGTAKEIGWAPLSLTQAGEQSPLNHLRDISVLHWHGDTFDLPAGATRLASTAQTLNQAYAVGEHALGLQFHPEVEARNFERWLIGHACEIASVPGLSVAGLREDTARHAEITAVRAAHLLSDWFGIGHDADVQPKVNA